MSSDGAVSGPDPTSAASRRLVAVVVLVGLLATTVAVFAARRVEHDAYDRRFGILADRATDVLDRRVQAQEASLTQLRNVAMLQHPMSRAAFTALAELGIREGLYAGARAVGFAHRVLPRDIPSFEAAVRADTSLDAAGYPDFQVQPPAQGEEAYVVDFVVPFELNVGAFGLNLAGFADRREAVEAARDRGDVVSTPPIVLVQGTGGNPGFILYQAVYDTLDIPLTAPARRRHFVGAVNIVFDTTVLLGDLVADRPEVALEVYDVGLTVDPAATAVDPERLIFDSDGELTGAQVEGANGVRRVVDLDVGDRRWRVIVTPTSALAGASSVLSLALGAAGSLITLLLGVTVLATARARDRAVLSAARDTLERALDTERAAVQELERTDRMRTTFLGTVSHELQTPLAAISGFTDLLERFEHDMSREERVDLVARIARNAASLSTMIGELLDFTRLERSAAELQPIPLDLGTSARLLVDQLGPILSEHELVLDLEDGVGAMADPNALERILTNLITNATRYAPAGSRIRVGVRAEVGPAGGGTEAKRAVLRVEDEGPGIPSDERELVFETFYRGAAAVEAVVGGTGIGLAVVRELVERQGGAVSVEGSPAGGARFVVRLPSASLSVR